MIRFLKDNFWQIVRFGLVGIFNTCNSLIIYYLLLILDINYLVANVLAYFVSCSIAFGIQRDFVFKSESGDGFKYYVIYISSFVIQMGLLYLLVDILQISDRLAPIITLGVTVPYNYLFSKFWTFKGNGVKYSHTFVVCAYKECMYLEECILSLLNQQVSSKVIMVTSTENEFIRNLVEKYKLPLYVRKGKSDIQKDWNFAYQQAKSDLVTIVHQDDVYESNYLGQVLRYFQRYRDVNFVCTDYYVLKNGERTTDLNSKLKRVLKFPLRFSCFNKRKFFKVMSLSLGNSINCPSVTYNKLLLGKGKVFTSKLKFSLDWETFIKLAKREGRIGYISKKLLNYRIHPEATTMLFIKNNDRYYEDRVCFEHIWPKVIVNLIMKFYVKASDTYTNVKED